MNSAPTQREKPCTQNALTPAMSKPAANGERRNARHRNAHTPNGLRLAGRRGVISIKAPHTHSR
jgi:hypothetical protein